MLCGQQAVPYDIVQIVRMVSSIWREDSDIAHRNGLLDFGGKKSYLFHWLGKAHCASELQHMRNVVEKTTNGNYGTVLITQVTTRERPICIQIGHFYYELRVMGSNGFPKLSGYCHKSPKRHARTSTMASHRRSVIEQCSANGFYDDRP